MKLRPVASAVVLSLIMSGVVTSASTAAPKKSLKLLWSDEFNGKKGALPSSKTWSFDLGGGGWGNSERQFYTKDPSNISMNGSGQLVITAKRISNEYAEQVSDAPGTEDILNRCSECQFTSARIKSSRKLSFQYGRLEARMQLPSGIGTWPAFWMLGGDLLDGVPWPECGEIDIMEYRGDFSDRITSVLHGPNTPPGSGVGSAYNHFGPLSDSFHTYALEWKKDEITFYVDDGQHGTVRKSDWYGGRWVYNQRFFMILNLAMGGTYAGEYIDPYLNEANLKIDYIRFYSINGVGKVFKK